MRMCYCLAALAFFGGAYAQQLLNNEKVLSLLKAGVDDDTVIALISQQPGAYTLSADDIVALKKAGASDKVLAAMIVRNNGGRPSAAAGAAVPPRQVTQAPPVPDARIRVYVADSQSWEIRGGWSAAGHANWYGASWGGGGYEAGGARPQTAEIIKTFNQRCPDVTVTNNVGIADFAVTLDHEGGKAYLRRRNKIVVFNRAGDAIYSDSTRSLGNSVKDACEAIRRNAVVRDRVNNAATNGIGDNPGAGGSDRLMADVAGGKRTTRAPENELRGPESAPGSAANVSEILITSEPAGAGVLINDVFLGVTPVTLRTQTGVGQPFSVVVTKAGYQRWRVQSVTVPGQSTIHAQLVAGATP